MRSLSTNICGQERWTGNRTTCFGLSAEILALDWQSMAEGSSTLEAELSIDAINFAFRIERCDCSCSPANVALVECSEYDFLDSSVSIFNNAANFIAVRNQSALIAKQCKVHQIEC